MKNIYPSVKKQKEIQLIIRKIHDKMFNPPDIITLTMQIVELFDLLIDEKAVSLIDGKLYVPAVQRERDRLNRETIENELIKE